MSGQLLKKLLIDTLDNSINIWYFHYSLNRNVEPFFTSRRQLWNMKKSASILYLIFLSFSSKQISIKFSSTWKRTLNLTGKETDQWENGFLSNSFELLNYSSNAFVIPFPKTSKLLTLQLLCAFVLIATFCSTLIKSFLSFHHFSLPQGRTANFYNWIYFFSSF